MGYEQNPIVNFVIMLLIIIGGIGFLTWNDLYRHRLRMRRYQMQSKVILLMTAILIFLPALFFFFVDFADMPLHERVLAALFQAVTPRTAGFNTVDLTCMTDVSKGF